MRVEEIYMEPGNSLLRDYFYRFKRLEPYFTYHPGDDSEFFRRAERLEKRNHPVSREQLADVLRQYHADELDHPAVRSNLERLCHSDSLVVVGGQQAGILTGPLYTIHKAITLIQLAEREERRLNRPVIPVFWIAGEDHDWDEVNHLHLLSTEGTVEKITLPVQVHGKPSVSNVFPDPDQLIQWIENVGRHLPDTPYKREWMDLLKELSRDRLSLSRHFARLLHHLFGRYGLLMIDSAFQPLRRLETPFFQWLIEENESLNREILKQADHLKQDGYPVTVDVGLDKANLFLSTDTDRKALYRTEDGTFFTKDGEIITHKELLERVYREPGILSNNVLTRPLMQEFLFPTLATVLGPGEIAYWALLKSAFSLAGMEMPVLFPRNSVTLVGRKGEKEMQRFQLTVDDVLHRLEAKKWSWLERQYHLDVDAVFGRVRSRIKEIYHPLIGEISGVRPDLKDLGNTNCGHIMKQVNFLEQETRKALEKREEVELQRFDLLEAEICPGGALQERVHNMIPWWNLYGKGWVDQLLQTPLVQKNHHRVVYL